MAKRKCSVCRIEDERGIKVDTSRSPDQWADELLVHRTTITRHIGHAPHLPPASGSLKSSKDIKNNGNDIVGEKVADRVIPLSEWLDDLRDDGFDPDDFVVSYGNSVWGQQPSEGELITLYANRFSATRKQKGAGEGPSWPVIQPAEAVVVTPSASTHRLQRIGDLKCNLKAGDTQVGFRVLADGTVIPFHDDSAMSVFVEACRAYSPDKITLLGDFLDLPSQGRFAQEASFAQTTQMAINRGHQFLAELRAAAPDAEIVLVEGNHDLRMQNFIQNNALAAFGLKRADMPAEWPVMSLPHLLRLDDLNVRYIDAYPAATDWDNDTTRNIHGTRANSKGSTTSQYSQDLPHISTWVGHTHRTEITYKTVMGPRGEPIESYTANPGCLCRTDGAVPSVHGAIGADGAPAVIVEDWQQGFGVLYYNETESWPSVYRIKNGVAIVDGYRIAA